MASFSSAETGDFNDYFMTTTDLIDRYVVGNLWVCGYNDYGQLGDNTIDRRSSPVQTIAKESNWKQVYCHRFNTTAIKTDGTLWSWGRNNYGQLGDDTSVSKISPIQTICGGNDWKQVACGESFTLAIKTDGTLWTWGYDGYGQLGINSQINKSSPVQTIAGGNNWKQVSCSRYHSMAIKTDGTLWCWGKNDYGQLGDNSVTYRYSPVQTICSGTNWKQVSGGDEHTAAIKTDGSLWTWGGNYYGRLGDNTATNKSSPVQTICNGTNWKQVFCGTYHTVAIKTDGSLWNWGYNDHGELGDNLYMHRSSPVQTICGGNNWKQVSCGNLHTSAIKTDGTLWSWGYNGQGQLGTNNLSWKSSPVQTICGGTNWNQVACGFYHTAALQFANGVGVE